MIRRNIWLVGAMSAAAVAALVAAPAQAASPLLPAHAATPVDCPTALPVTEAVDGLTGHGYTVERGTTPEPFTAKVLGRLKDGITPGVDLILAELDSPAIRRSGGVWAGMSGSPVYADDGRLIGSVSYSLSSSSPVAGITPASALGTVMDGDPDGLAGRKFRRTTPIRPSASVARQLAGTGQVSLAEATAGFRPLQVPMLVSGASSPRAKAFLNKLQAKSGALVMAGGSSAPTTSSAPVSPLSGGDNFAVTVAYGDATLGGVGTATYTCHGRAVAFGHPFLGYGVTTMAAHSASAVYVQSDPVMGSFKVANIGPVIGTVDRDRTLGLRAKVGAGPIAATISSKITRVEGGAVRTGTTRVVEPSFTADAAAFHTMYNVDRVLGSTASVGTARLSLGIKGRRANGKAFTLTVGDTFTDVDHQNPIDLQTANWVYTAVSQLLGQDFEAVSITSLNLYGSVSSKASLMGTPTIQVLSGKSWVSPVAGVRAVAGKPVKGRVVLKVVRGTAKTTVATTVTPATWMRGKELAYSVEGGYGFGELAEDPTATSFDALLTQLRSAPRSDEVRLAVVREDGRSVLHSRYRTALSVRDFVEEFDLVVR